MSVIIHFYVYKKHNYVVYNISGIHMESQVDNYQSPSCSMKAYYTLHHTRDGQQWGNVELSIDINVIA